VEQKASQSSGSFATTGNLSNSGPASSSIPTMDSKSQVGSASDSTSTLGSQPRVGSPNDSSRASGDIADQAKDVASSLVDFAKDKASSRLAPEIESACQNLTGTASAIRSLSTQLRDQDMGDYAKYVDQAAAQIENVSQFLDGKDLDDLVWETEQFARRQPAFFIGGAIALGFLASRFLKATTPTPERPTYSGSTGQYRAPTYSPSRPRYSPPSQPTTYGASASTAYAKPSTPRSSLGPGSTSGRSSPNDVTNSGDVSAEMTGSSATSNPGFNTQSGRS